MKSVLIAGAGGLVGRNLYLKLQNNFEVFPLVNNSPIINSRTIKLDLSSNWRDDILPKGIDVIVQCLQHNSNMDSKSDFDKIHGVNFTSTYKLLEYGKRIGIQKFVFFSSGGIYSSRTRPLTEKDPITSFPNKDPYLHSKIASESLLTEYRDFFEICTLRPFFIFGHLQNGFRLIPRIFNAVRNNSEIVLSNKNGLLFNPINVTDLVNLVNFMLTHNLNGIFNIAGKHEIFLREVINLAESVLEKQANIVFRDEKDRDVILGDISKIQNLCDYQAWSNPLKMIEEIYIDMSKLQLR